MTKKSKVLNFIQTILRQIEFLNSGIICFAYKDEKLDWYYVCLNNFDYYKYDKKFSSVSKLFHKVAKKLNIKIVFCYMIPVESKLIKLNENNNLFINI